MKNSSIAVLGVLLSAYTAGAAPTPLTSCGQTVTEAILTGDLDCSATPPGFAVVIAPGGEFDLAGYQLTSAAATPETTSGAVLCEGDCTVRGNGGTLLSTGGSSTNTYGVLGSSSIRSKVTVTGLTISGYKWGVDSRKATLFESTVTGSFVGAVARQLTIIRCVLEQNVHAAGGRNLYVTESVVQDNVRGLSPVRAEIRDTTITGHVQAGVAAMSTPTRRLRFYDSVVDGNCLGPNGDDCADIITVGRNRPQLSNTVCSTSGRYNGGTFTTWGVCALD